MLELCAGGELQRLLDEEERLSEGAARRALRHVLEGLAHLHAQRVAHLDLKPQNLLLSAGGEELLICDFGISRAIQPGAHVREILGTRDYVGEFEIWSNFLLYFDRRGHQFIVIYFLICLLDINSSIYLYKFHSISLRNT